MFPRAAAKLLTPIRPIVHTRGTVVSGPPRNRITLTEKIAHGVIITVGVMAIPAWVLAHISEYRRHE